MLASMPPCLHLPTYAWGDAPGLLLGFLYLLSPIEVHLSAETDAFLYLGIVLTEESDTFVFVFARTHTHKCAFIVSRVG